MHRQCWRRTRSLSRDDGKRSDGVTVLPWANGRCMIRDFTCPDTLAASHLNRAVISPSAVANNAESQTTDQHQEMYVEYLLMIVHDRNDLRCDPVEQLIFVRPDGLGKEQAGDRTMMMTTSDSAEIFQTI